MTFEMVRIGWPNTAAILLLAAMPVIALTTTTDLRSQAGQIEAAAVCQTVDACSFAAAAATDIVAE